MDWDRIFMILTNGNYLMTKLVVFGPGLISFDKDSGMKTSKNKNSLLVFTNQYVKSLKVFPASEYFSESENNSPCKFTLNSCNFRSDLRFFAPRTLVEI